MFRKTLLIGFSLLSLCYSTAFADLGDTYATSCQRYGSKGVIDRENHAILWKVPDTINGYWIVSETFVKNQCVSILYVASGGDVVEGGLWRMLQMNSLVDTTWQEYSHEDNKRAFVTLDKKLYGLAWLSNTGHQIIRVAYKSYLEAHNLFTTSTVSEESAPVEDPVQSLDLGTSKTSI